MPIYEYKCHTCKEEFQALIMNSEEQEALTCPACGGREMSRLISRVAYHVSEADRLADYNPNSPQDDSFYKDTRNIGLQAKKRAQQMGVDLGSGFESKLDKLRRDPGSVLDTTE
ncbi:MAG: zinc ribbon domain-containing protein [Deltaproteobacteria bacterium]|nr:zinc ribbon domain-containing protein [Deltaproteobacteria bacterium]MCF8120302.1 zinc ribbon domain-containing protein [Deltaproteobacteria bacterium]